MRSLPYFCRLYAESNIDLPRLFISFLRIHFGPHMYQLLGKMTLHLATPPCIRIMSITRNLVSAEVYPLLGPEKLDFEHLVADTVQIRLMKRTVVTGAQSSARYALEEWFVPMQGIGTHLSAVMVLPTISAKLTGHEISKLH